MAAFLYRNQSASSVWLTSFVAQMFQEASFYEWENFIYIDPEVMSCSVSNVRTKDGQDIARVDVNILIEPFICVLLFSYSAWRNYN
jgi:hypothetical protein